MAARLTAAEVPHAVRVFPGSDHGRTYADRAIGPTIEFLRRRLR
jgi:S-formylglutathione hydrolase FrmB